MNRIGINQTRIGDVSVTLLTDKNFFFEMTESKKNKTVAFHRTNVQALFRILREEVEKVQMV